MAEPGGDPKRTTADLAALPPELAQQSLSQTTMILPHDAAVKAIELLTQRGRRLESWEGWVKLRNGSRARSLNHDGSFALSPDPARAATAATAAIRKAQSAWDRNPEYLDGALYFSLSFGAA